MKDARIVVGVTGGIAAYKTASLVSALVQRGAQVDVIMTAEAEKFVGPLTFSALTARPVYSSLWESPEKIPHIRLVREAQVAIVVPATANLIAKLAQGIADDMLTTALLAARIPLLIAPAMNDAMYRSGATQDNLRILRERGYTIVEPETGFLAERESGIGRLANEETLLAALDLALSRTQSLRGKRVLITAGPTREAFDPVRFVSNPSTGTTGIELAREAHLRGAAVTLVLGPTHVEPPAGVTSIRVTTAQEMYDAALEQARGQDLIIATAAVSDWRPAERSEHKVKKEASGATVAMERTVDILAALGERKKKAFLVGFAAETHDHERNAREKMHRKHADAIAVNDVANDRGFGAQPNSLTVLWGEKERRELGESSKSILAARLLDCIAYLMPEVPCS